MPCSEFFANMNPTEMGDFGLTIKEEDEIAAFMKTLSDSCTKYFSV